MSKEEFEWLVDGFEQHSGRLVVGKRVQTFCSKGKPASGCGVLLDRCCCLFSQIQHFFKGTIFHTNCQRTCQNSSNKIENQSFKTKAKSRDVTLLLIV